MLYAIAATTKSVIGMSSQGEISPRIAELNTLIPMCMRMVIIDLGSTESTENNNVEFLAKIVFEHHDDYYVEG